MLLLTAIFSAALLSPQQANADIDLVQRALETVHPGLHRYTSQREMDAQFAKLRAEVGEGIEPARFYVEISRLLSAIRCDHTKAELPPDLAKLRETSATHLPFRFRVFDGRMFVASSDPAQPIARGTEIVEIDGRPVRSIIRELSELVAYDGKTRWVVDTKLASDSDLLGNDFDHFFPLVYGFRDEHRLQIREPDGERRTMRVKPITIADWAKLEWSGKPYRSDFSSAVSFRMLDETTGFLRIDTFVNYRKPADPKAVYEPIFRELADRGANHLILDLRANVGGSNEPAAELARYFFTEPFRVIRSVRLKAIRYGDLPQFIETWGDRKAIFEPEKTKFRRVEGGMFEETTASSSYTPVERYAFGGRVTILAGPANASGSTMLIARLSELPRVRVIGMPTGGSAEGPTAGQIFFVKLPNSGIRVRVPVKQSLTDVKSFKRGHGVDPDVRVEETLADFLANRDRALEVALRK